MIVGGVYLIQTSIAFDEKIVGMLLIGMSVVLAIPLVWPVMFRAEGRGSAIDLGVRRLRVEGRAGALAASLVAAVIVIGSATNIYVLSVVDDFNSSSQSLVAPHQVTFESGGDPAVPGPDAVAEVQDALNAQSPVKVFDADGAVTSMTGATLLLQDVKNLERLVGRSLTTPERRSLGEGGMLRTKSDAVGDIEFQTTQGKLVTVPSTPIKDIDPSFRNIDGFMLAGAAEGRGIEASVTSFVFIDVPDSIIERVPDIAEKLGIDPSLLRVYKVPDEVTVPLTSLLSALVVAILAALTVFAYGAGVTRRMRPHLASLRSLGLPRKWLFSMLGTQFVGIVLLALLSGMVGGAIAAMTMLGLRSSDSAVAVPWLFLAVTAVLLVTSSLLSALAGARRLGAAERLEHFSSESEPTGS